MTAGGTVKNHQTHVDELVVGGLRIANVRGVINEHLQTPDDAVLLGGQLLGNDFDLHLFDDRLFLQSSRLRGESRLHSLLVRNLILKSHIFYHECGLSEGNPADIGACYSSLQALESEEDLLARKYTSLSEALELTPPFGF